jgi:hypothetical protein
MVSCSCWLLIVDVHLIFQSNHSITTRPIPRSHVVAPEHGAFPNAIAEVELDPCFLPGGARGAQPEMREGWDEVIRGVQRWNGRFIIGDQVRVDRSYSKRVICENR